MQQSYMWSVGIDLGSQQHQVCILGPDGKAKQVIVPHRGEAASRLVAQLLEVSKQQPERVAVGIETPRGPIVETLLGQGFHVYAVNPKQLDRFRDRYSVAGAKDDRRDAFVLAATVCTDRGAYRRSQVEEDCLVEIRELSRAQDELNEDTTRLINQLKGLLQAYYPQFLDVCPDLDCKWAWALWELVPTPQRAEKLDEVQVAALLKQYRVRRLKASQVLEMLQVPGFQMSQASLRACQSHVELLLPRLRVTLEQQKSCEKRLKAQLKGLEDTPESIWAQDAAVMQSMPGIGVGVVTTLLSEAPEAIKTRDYAALRALTGVAPITRQSGKRRQVGMRRGCNQRLRNAIYHWMRSYTILDPYGKAYYQQLRARGLSHGRAFRTIADRMLKTLVAMMRSGTAYDPTRRRPLESSAA